uniref:ATP-dependent DNA helicase n=1 Tax=Aegilops tauschii subsp. strangulata TaxID=200361 RepID=A0A453CCJ0_AEGTS
MRMMEYYAYRIQQRLNQSVVLQTSGKLFLQFIVDAATCIEQWRLNWYRMHQGTLRTELYSGQDAMAICRWAGYPDLFITFTCNPKWPEIQIMLDFLDARYLSAGEASWRIFGFELQHWQPSVQRLQFHLQDEQMVVFPDSTDIDKIVHRPGGRTAHSRFHIPLNITNESTCDIKQGSYLADLQFTK